MFIKELEEALLESPSILPVHSVKDVRPTFFPGSCFQAVCRRDDVARLSGRFHAANLRQGARVERAVCGAAQLRHLRPDLDLRDCVERDTSMRKVEAGNMNGDGCQSRTGSVSV